MNLGLELIGWIGAVGYTLCIFPLAYRVWQTHETVALTWGFLWLWGIGEIFTLAYVIIGNYILNEWQIPLIVNYAINLFTLYYLFYAKIKYEKASDK